MRARAQPYWRLAQSRSIFAIRGWRQTAAAAARGAISGVIERPRPALASAAKGFGRRPAAMPDR